MNFGKSVFHNPKMTDATYNNTTKFPEGFNPEQYEMINVDKSDT